MNKEKTSMVHTTKTRATLGVIGLAFFSILTYLYLIKMINRDAWLGLGLLDLFVVTVTIAFMERRTKQNPSQKSCQVF
jgi:hypothetical protein